MSEVATMTGFVRGAYPERIESRPSRLDEIAGQLVGAGVRRIRSRILPSQAIAQESIAQEAAFRGLDTAELDRVRDELRAELRSSGFAPQIVARVFALVREHADRTLGMRPYEVQLIGAHILLEGRLAEMETGEGKTLTATLPACAAALAGLPVHVISVNDYLVARDAEEMRPLYAALGLSVGAIQSGMDVATRRTQYACDVTYVSNKEIAFDYLKDRITLGRERSRTRLQLERLARGSSRMDQLVLRGLVFGIVDEADSVLVDEARTPLIITAGDTGEELNDDIYETAVELALELEAETHFELNPRERSTRLTPDGAIRLDELADSLGGIWRGPNRRSHLVGQALSALHLYHRDRDYLVVEGKIQIIDESTGRVMEDRSWEQGLHQMIEAKEDCDITGQSEALAKISYQRFFRRYRHLAGMTGTAREVAGEVWSVYRLGVTRVPTHRPIQREDLGETVYATAEERWDAVVERVMTLHDSGRPVLVGTRSVEASETLGARLTAAGLEHRILNARQDAEEAAIIARAGDAGAITVATNMAGRGTDIKPDTAVLERGGLHVLATERNEAGRIDRQLFGRCGRQGNAGSYEVVASLEDEIVVGYAGRLLDPAINGSQRVRRSLLSFAQRRAERTHARARRNVMKSDEAGETRLAFAGQGE